MDQVNREVVCEKREQKTNCETLTLILTQMTTENPQSWNSAKRYQSNL